MTSASSLNLKKTIVFIYFLDTILTINCINVKYDGKLNIINNIIFKKYRKHKIIVFENDPKLGAKLPKLFLKIASKGFGRVFLFML